MSSPKRLDELRTILIEVTFSIMPPEFYEGEPWALSLALSDHVTRIQRVKFSYAFVGIAVQFHVSTKISFKIRFHLEGNFINQ